MAEETTARRRAGRVAKPIEDAIAEVLRVPGEPGATLARLLVEIGRALLECGKG